MEDIFSGVSSAPKYKVEKFTDNGLVSALAGLSLETTEYSEMSEEIVVDKKRPAHRLLVIVNLRWLVDS